MATPRRRKPREIRMTASTPLRNLLIVAATGFCALLGAANVMAQGDASLTGVFSYVIAGQSGNGSFSCSGQPTCTGTYTDIFHAAGCNNTLIVTAPFTATGINVAQAGPVQGTV